MRAKFAWGEGGLSLVEATIILMVLSIMTGVAVPSINDFIQDSKDAKAKEDVDAIGTAVARMRGDIGETWVLQDGNGTTASDPPLHTAANRVDLLVSQGTLPTVGVARSGGGTPDWSASVNDTSVQRLEHHLIQNTPSNLAANAYRTAVNMSNLATFDPDSGAQFNSEFAWRGAYLSDPLGPDPWGTRYGVNVEFLAKALGAGPAGNVNDVFVLCAGRNLTTDTRFDTDGPTAGGDDILLLVSGETR